MNTLKSTFTAIILLLCSTFYAQNGNAVGHVYFSLKSLGNNKWGVFVKPSDSLNPTTQIATGSGQVTIVTSLSFSYDKFTNYGGTWIENARVNGPAEAPENSYVSFGFVMDEPKIKLYPNEETLLFSFETKDDFADNIALIENNNDPFSTPNSYGTNPGNDIGMIDYGVKGSLLYYLYDGNYIEENKPVQAILAKYKESKASYTPRQESQSATSASKNYDIAELPR